MNLIKCPNCNNELNQEDNFCSKCGNQVKKQDTKEIFEELNQIFSMKKTFTEDDLYVTCEKCNTKQIIDYKCCNCEEGLAKYLTPIRYAHISANMVNNTNKAKINVLDDYIYLRINDKFTNVYFNDNNKKVIIFNKEIELTNLSKKLSLIHRLFNDALDNWFCEFEFTTPYESFEKLTSHCFEIHCIMIEFLKFIAEYTEVKDYKIYQILTEDSTTFLNAYREIMEDETTKFQINLKKTVGEYKTKNNELINSTIGNQLGMMYGSRSNLLTAVGTFFNVAKIDNTSKELYENCDNQMLDEAERVCNDTLQRIQVEAEYFINTCLLVVGCTYINPEDQIIKKIIMDMYKFQAKPHELKGVDYFLENPYVYDNYKYILNDIKDTDIDAFIEIIKFYGMDDYIKEEILDEENEELKQKYIKLFAD